MADLRKFNPRMKALFITLIALVFSCVLLANDRKFDHLTSDEGLSDNFVRRVVCDSYGFVWVATKDGLSQYDGYSVKVFKHEPGNEHSLPSSYVADVVEDHNGNLWIATGRGLALYNREFGRIDQFLFEGTSFNNALYEFALVGNDLWIATQDGVCRFDIDTKDVFWIFSTKNTLGIDDRYTRTARVVADSHGNIWAGFGASNGVVKYDAETGETKQFIQISDGSQRIPGSGVGALYCLNDSVLLVGCVDYGAIILNVNTGEYKKFDDSHACTENGLNTVWYFHQDHEKNIWVAAINGGLFLYDSTYTFQHNFLPSVSDGYSLNSRSISSIAEDKHGNLWFGTHGGGVNVLYTRKNLFPHFKSSPLPNSLSNDFVSCFYELPNGEVLVGTDGGGLNKFDPKTNSFNCFTIKDGIPGNSILSIQPYDENQVVVTTWDKGFFIFNFVTGQVTESFRYNEKSSNSISYPYLKNVIRRGDSLFISTHGTGVNIYDIQNKKFLRGDADKSLAYLLTPETVNEIVFDENNEMWVTATKGLYRIKGDSIFAYMPDMANPASIREKYVASVFIDSKNRIWFGTINGLNLYNEKKDSFIAFEQYPSLKNAIVSICEDDNGNLWLGTNSGLVKFNPDSNTVAVFNEVDGLQGNQFYERSAYKDLQGNLYFGGMNGFNRFNPADIQADTTQPLVCFTDFKVFYVSQDYNDESSVLKKHINFTDEIVLDYSQKIITIDFVALHMLASSKNGYKYILEGFDDVWYSVGTNKSATYTNLSPGEYVFKVQASNADKVWSQHPKSVRIVVLPPWWMTWWFRILVAFISIWIFFLVLYLRTWRMKKINAMLENKVRKRTAELLDSNYQLALKKSELEENKEELQVSNEKLRETVYTKDRFFSIIAHDLKSPLNALLGFSDILVRNWGHTPEEKKYRFIELINISSHNLSALLANLLDWSRTQTGRLKVSCEEIDVAERVSINIHLLQNQAKSKHIQLISNLDKDVFLYADRNMIDTILRNIISNAIKYTPQGGKVEASSRIVNDGMVEISVADNGVGMTENQLESLFKVDKSVSTKGTDKEQGTGLGLIVSYEFVKANNGTIEVFSDKNVGTTFVLQFPLPK